MERESFVFFTSWMEGIDGYPENKQAEIVLALVRYCAYGIEPDLSKPHVKMAYLFAKPVIDKNNSVWLRNKQNAKNAGAPTGNQNAANQSKNNPKTIQEQSKNNPYVDVYVDVDKEKDILKYIPKEKEPTKRFVPPTIGEVRAYIQEKGYDVDAEAFVAFYESKGWKVGNQPMKSWKAATVTWKKKQEQMGERVKPLYQNGPTNVHFEGEDRSIWDKVKIDLQNNNY